MATPSPDALLIGLGEALRHVQAADATALGRSWEREVNRTVKQWSAEVSPQQQATVERQVEAAVHAQSLDALAQLHVPAFGADLLLASSRTMAANGVDAVLREAKAQGATLAPPPPVAGVTLADWARVAADVLASGYAAGVAREALRLMRPGATAGAVVDGVRRYLGDLTDRSVRDTVGGLLTRALNLGKLAVYGAPHPGWSVQLVADETLDGATCEPCRKIDGQVLPTQEAADLAYGGAGYLFCQGGTRCRGTVRGEWRPVDDAGNAWTLPALLAGIMDPHSPGRAAR